MKNLDKYKNADEAYIAFIGFCGIANAKPEQMQRRSAERLAR